MYDDTHESVLMHITNLEKRYEQQAQTVCNQLQTAYVGEAFSGGNPVDDPLMVGVYTYSIKDISDFWYFTTLNT